MRIHFRFAALALLAFAAFQPATSSAVITNPTPQRSYVSLSGNDGNSCGPGFPCRTWQAALAQTQPGGEILTLDSGGFGVLNITQSVTLVVPSGVYGGMSPAANVTGITINAPGAVVVIKGVSIKGQSLTGTVGIDVQQAASVLIQDSSLAALGTGIQVEAGVNLTIENVGMRFCNAGMVLSPSASAPALVTMSNSAVSYSAGDGVAVNDNARLSVSSSLFSFNGGYGLNATGTVASGTNQFGVGVDIENSRMEFNGSGGIQVADTSTANTNATSDVTARLTRVNIEGGTNCVNVAGVANAILLGNVIGACNTGINVATNALAKTMGSGSNEVGGNSQTNIGGTINGALTQKAYY